MYCRNCGQKAKENAKFCSKCGTVIQNPQTIGTDEKPTVTAAPAIQVKAQEVEVMLNKKPKASKPTAYMMIAAAVVLVVAIGSVSYVLGVSPEYRGAVSLMKSGLYSEAAAVFATLDPQYKDVDEKLAECNSMISYQIAADLMNSGTYTGAAEIFISLEDFKDSAQLAQTCTNKATYQEALACMDSGDYETAQIKLTALGNFEDSKTLLAECEKGIQYNQATVLMQKGEIEQAKTIYLSLGDFKDSALMAENCNRSVAYDRAKALYDKGDYEAAKTAFAALGEYSDAKAMSTKCQNQIDYKKAVDLMKSGDKAGAEKIFTALGGFKDSKELALDCRYSADYEKAKTYMQQGNYAEASKLLETMASANYRDSKTLLSDCKKGPTTSSKNNNTNDAAYKYTYDQAVAAFNSQYYYTAYKLFGEILTYKDSMHYYDLCVQTPSSAVLYKNDNYTQNECQISIDATLTKKYYVKIYNGSTLVYEIFYNQGTSASYPLKKGTYTIKFAYAGNEEKWFGTKEKFGDKGEYYVALVKGSQTIEIQSDFALAIGGVYKRLSIVWGKPEIDKQSISASNF